MIGEKLGSYRIESVLGSGTTAVVYRGTNEETGLAAAVKVLRSDLPDGRESLGRFEREAQILQQFGHPNIVRFLATGRFRETSYITMEFIDGATLERILKDHERLHWEMAAEIGIQISDALHYVHEHGVVHRGLKPSHLMVTADWQIKLIDFGIAKGLGATALTTAGRVLGTPAYMAPEQIQGTPAISFKTDLYSFGGVMYEMLVGKAPFEGGSPILLLARHLTEPPPRPGAMVEGIPTALDELIVSLMAKSPANRPRDAEAVKKVLIGILPLAEPLPN